LGEAPARFRGALAVPAAVSRRRTRAAGGRPRQLADHDGVRGLRRRAARATALAAARRRAGTANAANSVSAGPVPGSLSRVLRRCVLRRDRRRHRGEKRRQLRVSHLLGAPEAAHLGQPARRALPAAAAGAARSLRQPSRRRDRQHLSRGKLPGQSGGRRRDRADAARQHRTGLPGRPVLHLLAIDAARRCARCRDRRIPLFRVQTADARARRSPKSITAWRLRCSSRSPASVSSAPRTPRPRRRGRSTS